MPHNAPSVEASPRVVKAGAAAAFGTPIAFNYADLRRACDDHLQVVQEQSRRLIGEATSSVERIRREAADAGRRDGRADGLKAADAEIAGRVEQLAKQQVEEHLLALLPVVQRLVEEIHREKDEWLARWEAEGVKLAAAIAEKLLRRTIAIDASAADALIADTLRLTVGAPELTVKLAPADHARLNGSIEPIAATVGRLGAVQVIADALITPGGCVVETNHGRIDGRVETQLERIVAELIG